MNTHQIAWLVAGGIGAALVAGFAMTLLPEIRRLLHVKKMRLRRTR